MSTAAHERRAGQRMRGSGMHILAHYTYFAYSAKVQISKEAYRKILTMSGSASKKVEKRLAGIECNGCNKIFASLFRYDQHRRSDALRGTACSALPDENRTSLYAVSRPNMSTASLLPRPAHRTRGGPAQTKRCSARNCV